MAIEDPTHEFDVSEQGRRLDRVLAQFVEAVEAGQAPDREALLAANPDLADELREFFANRDGIEHAMGAVRRPSLPPGVLPTLRYFGDYELLEEIARGGMGIVYKARQTSLNRIVAVKMILAGQLATADDVRRFRTEAEAAANLQHANIVAVHEVGVHENHHYFSMDFVEGQNLAALVLENPLPARRAAEYVQTIARAVHYAHQQGTLHRDLKPSNVLIDAWDQVRITDFGLATRVTADHTLTQTGQVLGTPSYMAPEQAAGKRGLVGPSADIYSHGVILYELLTGRPPFRAESAIETLHQVIHVEPASPRLLNPHIPRDLETICLKCLQKEPHKRYGTAELLADDLRRYLAGEPIHARPIGRAERLWRWSRRNPVPANLSALLLAALVAIAVMSSWGYFRERSHGREITEKNVQIGRALQAESQSKEETTLLLDRERDARAETTRNLYQSLVRQAEATRLARREGYRRQVWSLLERARQLDTPAVNVDELRQEAIKSLGDFAGLEPAVLRGFSAPIRSIALEGRSRFLAVGLQNGDICLHAPRTGNEIARLQQHKAPIVQLVFLRTGVLVSADFAGAIGFWSEGADQKWTSRQSMSVGGTVVCLQETVDGSCLACAPHG